MFLDGDELWIQVDRAQKTFLNGNQFLKQQDAFGLAEALQRVKSVRQGAFFLFEWSGNVDGQSCRLNDPGSLCTDLVDKRRYVPLVLCTGVEEIHEVPVKFLKTPASAFVCWDNDLGLDLLCEDGDVPCVAMILLPLVPHETPLVLERPSAVALPFGRPGHSIYHGQPFLRMLTEQMELHLSDTVEDKPTFRTASPVAAAGVL